MEYSVLSNARKMPMLGFGVFKVTDKAECKQAVLNAIRTGYRLIDTAAVYDNEDAVGEAVREAIAEGLCTREALFITSKLWVQDMANTGMAKAGIAASLKKSGLEYFDRSASPIMRVRSARLACWRPKFSPAKITSLPSRTRWW